MDAETQVSQRYPKSKLRVPRWSGNRNDHTQQLPSTQPGVMVSTPSLLTGGVSSAASTPVLLSTRTKKAGRSRYKRRTRVKSVVRDDENQSASSAIESSSEESENSSSHESVNSKNAPVAVASSTSGRNHLRQCQYTESGVQIKPRLGLSLALGNFSPTKSRKIQKRVQAELNCAGFPTLDSESEDVLPTSSSTAPTRKRRNRDGENMNYSKGNRLQRSRARSKGDSVEDCNHSDDDGSYRNKASASVIEPSTNKSPLLQKTTVKPVKLSRRDHSSEDSDDYTEVPINGSMLYDKSEYVKILSCCSLTWPYSVCVLSSLFLLLLIIPRTGGFTGNNYRRYRPNLVDVPTVSSNSHFVLGTHQKNGVTFKVKVPGRINQYLREYQREGINFLYSR